jgi:hypothetical protein
VEHNNLRHRLPTCRHRRPADRPRQLHRPAGRPATDPLNRQVQQGGRITPRDLCYDCRRLSVTAESEAALGKLGEAGAGSGQNGSAGPRSGGQTWEFAPRGVFNASAAPHEPEGRGPTAASHMDREAGDDESGDPGLEADGWAAAMPRAPPEEGPPEDPQGAMVRTLARGPR